MTNLVGFLIIDFFTVQDLKMLTYLVGFLLINFFAVKDLKRLAFLLHVLAIKANKTNTSTFILDAPKNLEGWRLMQVVDK